METKKSKLKIKATTNTNKIYLLKKDYIINNSYSTLILQKEKKINILKNVPNNIFNIEQKKDQNILTIENISKNLGGKPILKDISFNLKQGTIIGLLGPNGSGKSTLFSNLIGKLLPDRGKIKMFNEDITNLPIHKRALKGISLLEQHKGLFNKMTCKENLYCILELYIKDKNKINNRINEYLNYFGLSYLANVKADHMSGGEYRKISILQRICNANIKILLLDEPLSALDPISITSIKKFILELKTSGISIIVSDHNFYALHDILDDCLIIRNGEVMIKGKPEEVVKNENAIKYYLGTNFKI